jgi:hypothetical protein
MGTHAAIPSSSTYADYESDSEDTLRFPERQKFNEELMAFGDRTRVRCCSDRTCSGWIQLPDPSSSSDKLPGARSRTEYDVLRTGRMVHSSRGCGAYEARSGANGAEWTSGACRTAGASGRARNGREDDVPGDQYFHYLSERFR